MKQKITISDLERLKKEGYIRDYIIKEGAENNSPNLRKSKYGNKKIEFDGHLFDSKKEYRRYLELKMLEKIGQITDLKLQVSFDLDVNDKKVARYIADFSYSKNGELVVEDVKSSFTKKLPVYRLKMKLMQSIHGITIKEV